MAEKLQMRILITVALNILSTHWFGDIILGFLWNSKVLKCHFDVVVVVVETLTAILFVVR